MVKAYKPILLKKPEQIYTGLMKDFTPGQLVHMKLSWKDKQAIPLNKDRGWVIGLGLGFQEIHPTWNLVIKMHHGVQDDSTHVLYVLCMNDILAVHFNLKRGKGKKTLILTGKEWRGLRDSYNRASWCLSGPGELFENLAETCPSEAS